MQYSISLACAAPTGSGIFAAAASFFTVPPAKPGVRFLSASGGLILENKYLYTGLSLFCLCRSNHFQVLYAMNLSDAKAVAESSISLGELCGYNFNTCS